MGNLILLQMIGMLIEPTNCEHQPRFVSVHISPVFLLNVRLELKERWSLERIEKEPLNESLRIECVYQYKSAHNELLFQDINSLMYLGALGKA